MWMLSIRSSKLAPHFRRWFTLYNRSLDAKDSVIDICAMMRLGVNHNVLNELETKYAEKIEEATALNASRHYLKGGSSMADVDNATFTLMSKLQGVNGANGANAELIHFTVKLVFLLYFEASSPISRTSWRRSCALQKLPRNAFVKVDDGAWVEEGRCRGRSRRSIR